MLLISCIPVVGVHYGDNHTGRDISCKLKKPKAIWPRTMSGPVTWPNRPQLAIVARRPKARYGHRWKLKPKCSTATSQFRKPSSMGVWSNWKARATSTRPRPWWTRRWRTASVIWARRRNNPSAPCACTDSPPVENPRPAPAGLFHVFFAFLSFFYTLKTYTSKNASHQIPSSYHWCIHKKT